MRIPYPAVGTVIDINLKNTVTCYGCGETITSMWRHDYQTCACKAVSVDGGWHYSRRSFTDTATWEEWEGAWQRDEERAREIEGSTRELALSPRQKMFRGGRAR